MKLIFLDIDGVMNSAMGSEPYLADMEVSKLKFLKRIIDETQCDGIVLTSDRRYSSVYMRLFNDAINKFDIKLIGETRRPKEIDNDIDDNRGRQIMDYLIESKSEIEKMVILDDNDEGISNLFDEIFIKVNRFYGLNEEIYAKIKMILD